VRKNREQERYKVQSGARRFRDLIGSKEKTETGEEKKTKMLTWISKRDEKKAGGVWKKTK